MLGLVPISAPPIPVRVPIPNTSSSNASRCPRQRIGLCSAGDRNVLSSSPPAMRMRNRTHTRNVCQGSSADCWAIRHAQLRLRPHRASQPSSRSCPLLNLDPRSPRRSDQKPHRARIHVRAETPRDRQRGSIAPAINCRHAARKRWPLCPLPSAASAVSSGRASGSGHASSPSPGPCQCRSVQTSRKGYKAHSRARHGQGCCPRMHSKRPSTVFSHDVFSVALPLAYRTGRPGKSFRVATMLLNS